MALEKNTTEVMREFAQFCRTGEYHPIAGVRDDRAQEYRRLAFNIVEHALRRAYPLTVRALGTEWSGLIQRFYAEWPLVSPELWKMPRQLCDFVGGTQYGMATGRPWLNDLLRFEWLEIEVFMMEDVDPGVVNAKGDLAGQPVVLNQEVVFSRFEYPVFKVAADQLTAQQGCFFLATYRHPQTLEACYTELSLLFLRVLEILQIQELSGSAAIERAASDLGIDLSGGDARRMLELLSAARSDGLILGVRNVDLR
ncbi:MAG: DNA-binding domain-containing protein [Oligoflexia bacterium]|nr:DNA-binding domain-containing protein [Oligoflexia bacterium]